MNFTRTQLQRLNGITRLMTCVVMLPACLLANAAHAQSLSTGFTYQGELRSAGAPASGSFDLQFRALNAANAGTQVGPTLCVDDVVVTNGRFTSLLDFGQIFGGQRLYLEVQVRDGALGTCTTSTGYTTLSPRQELAATPYATYAVSAAQASTLGGQPRSFFQDAANLTVGTLPDARLSSNIARTNTANVFAGSVEAPSFVGSLVGNAATATNATNLGGQPAAFYQSATNITSGTLADTRLSSNIARLNGTNTFTTNVTAPAFIGALTGNATTATTASNATNLNGQPAAFYLNAANMNAGTLPIARGGTNATTIGVAGTVAISNGTSLVYSNLGFPGFYFRYNGGGSSSFSAIQASDLPEFAGDVTGFIQSTRVTRLQNRPVSSTAPVNGQVLTFTGSSWTPATLPSPSVVSVGEDVRFIRGSIFTAGSISQGSGFTVTRPVTGEYRITFAQPFAQAPTVTATVFDATVPQIATISSLSTSVVVIRLWSITGAAVNSDFHFIAVGPQ